MVLYFFFSLMTFPIPASIFSVRSLNNLDSSSSEVRLSFRFSVSWATRKIHKDQIDLLPHFLRYSTLWNHFRVPKNIFFRCHFWYLSLDLYIMKILNEKTQITFKTRSGGYVRKTKWNSIQTNFYFYSNLIPYLFSSWWPCMTSEFLNFQRN